MFALRVELVVKDASFPTSLNEVSVNVLQRRSGEFMPLTAIGADKFDEVHVVLTF
jgi:hypothetical protein